MCQVWFHWCRMEGSNCLLFLKIHSTSMLTEDCINILATTSCSWLIRRFKSIKTLVCFSHVLLINPFKLFMCAIVSFIFKVALVPIQFHHVMLRMWLPALEQFLNSFLVLLLSSLSCTGWFDYLCSHASWDKNVLISLRPMPWFEWYSFKVECRH